MRDAYSHFSPEAVERFPGYFNYTVTAGYWINNGEMIGLNCGYYTTGGRNHVADYSGEYKLDMIIKGYRMGFQYQNVYFFNNNIGLYAQIKAGTIMSLFEQEMTLNIYNVTSSADHSEYSGISFFGEPSVGLIYSLKNNISLDVNAGYQFDTNARLYKNGNRDIELQRYEKDHVKVNWSGLRLALGVTYYLKLK